MKALSLVIMLSTISQGALAAQGVIHFTGSIVESACKMNAVNKTVTAHCMRGGVKSDRVIKLTGQNQTLPYSLGDVSIKNRANIRTVTISYR